ncbi:MULTISPECIES: hypothetical protein [unclassified Bradyrhizobium]|uniref:hypothetical protein n=1 Tax=unclassified Bradyrhizobium TaxID=2631580 RepID=UPI0029162F3C|nr:MULTISPECIES: hypothetical protein [unclassified Bradyrhizobium]
MTSKGDALALAIALCSSEETLLGPTDSKICATALRHYARERSRSTLLLLIRLIALVCAVSIVACALTYETPHVSAARDASAKETTAFENTPPVPHMWLSAAEVHTSNVLFLNKLPSSIEAQATTAAARPYDDD